MFKNDIFISYKSEEFSWAEGGQEGAEHAGSSPPNRLVATPATRSTSPGHRAGRCGDLSGNVRATAERLLAKRIAEDVPGVVEVRNELELDPARFPGRTVRWPTADFPVGPPATARRGRGSTSRRRLRSTGWSARSGQERSRRGSGIEIEDVIC